MSSSARRGQVEPLPALLGLAAFGVALSLYGTTLAAVPLGSTESVPDATMTKTMETITEGTVVVPGRLADLEGRLPAGTTVRIRAEGRVWQLGPERTPGDSPTVVRHVLVQRPDGAVPGIVRVSV